MLIYAGYRLAAPKHFFETYKIGKEQLAIFFTTILVTLVEDLLLGIAAGILLKMLFHFFNGANFKNLFRANYKIEENQKFMLIDIFGVAVFSNLISFKKLFSDIPKSKPVIIDFSKAKLIDHSFLSFIRQFQSEFDFEGGNIQIKGLENHQSFSDHELAARKLRVKS